MYEEQSYVLTSVLHITFKRTCDKCGISLLHFGRIARHNSGVDSGVDSDVHNQYCSYSYYWYCYSY